MRLDRIRNRIILVACLLLIFISLTASSCADTANPGISKVIEKEEPAKYLVLLCIDACRPDYFEFSDIPNIKKLISEGITYTNAWVGQMRNDTPPGHVAMSTGSFAKNNGVLGFVWKDGKTGKAIRPTNWQSITSGELNQIIAASGCSSIGSIYKKVYPAAKIAAISSDKYYAAAALGANSANYIIFYTNDKEANKETIGTHSLKPATVNGYQAPANIMDNPKLIRKKVNAWDGDTWAVEISLQLFEQERPEIILINLPQTDHTGHATGGIIDKKSMSQVINNVDLQIGRIVEAYKKAGIYEKTIFVVTSDHGMTPWQYTIQDSAVEDILSEYNAVPGGRVEYYLKDSSKSAEAAERISGLQVQGIHGVYYKVKKSDNSYSYIPAPSTMKTIDTQLDACYRYLTSTYASARSPDLVFFTAENWKAGTSNMRADHGEATWDNQHIPLIISGPGIKKGIASSFPARLVDIAPTVLAAMGLKPEKMDGIVLADALVTPADELVRLQLTTNTQLNSLKEALKNRHDRDIQNER